MRAALASISTIGCLVEVGSRSAGGPTSAVSATAFDPQISAAAAH
jgi:hypothetical protein